MSFRAGGTGMGSAASTFGEGGGAFVSMIGIASRTGIESVGRDGTTGGGVSLNGVGPGDQDGCALGNGTAVARGGGVSISGIASDETAGAGDGEVMTRTVMGIGLESTAGCRMPNTKMANSPAVISAAAAKLTRSCFSAARREAD